tara:strand:- start:49608 stop:50471 length:864 start_codon:yes stop_codon:yes gene_type:complete
MQDILITRPESFPETFPLLTDMIVERGTMDDWEQLHELHYKAEGRIVGRTWRCMLGDQLIAVMIVSSPRLLLAGRHEAFPKLKPGNDNKLTNTYRAKYVNKHFNLNSRIVVDTMFRSVGVSYRMLNLVSRMEGKSFMEIQSSMSRFNPFAIKAGFKFTKPRSAKAYDAGLTFMRRYFTSHPSDHQAILDELESMGSRLRARTLKAVREFYYRHSAREKTGVNLGAKEDNMARIEGYTPAFLIKNLQQLVFASPMYGVYPNPDVGRKLPESLPLIAFDRQRTDEPLRL